ncbi:hypothetical protein C4556_02655 [Candidatus Parcubacteria bacterium]|nr:MAG: hypothetical protein C4556_02655 [Candidatus Parcubacteria bacterium]
MNQEPASQPAPEASEPVIVTLSAQNDSGMSGTATLTDMDGSTLVVLVLAGAPAGIAQPAHIHTGSCAEIGGVVYPLTFPVNGVSETTLGVSLETILAQLPLALNVHKSAEEVSVYVACGDLTQ